MTVHYPGGTVTAAKGFIFWLFDGVESRWQPKEGGDGKGKRKYGTAQRASARAGRVHFLKLNDGSTRSVRVTGATKRFVDAVLQFGDTQRIERIYTQSGTKYGQQLHKLT
jgi:hypothetical protein